MKKTIALLISISFLLMAISGVQANALTLTATPSSVESGKTVTLTIVADNPGNKTLVNTFVVAYLPNVLAATGASVPIYSEYTDPKIGMYGFLLGDITPGQEKTVDITALANSPAGTALDTLAVLFEPVANGSIQVAEDSLSVSVIPPIQGPPSVSLGNSTQETNSAVQQTSNSCVANWICSDWTACVNGTQTRTCTDSNNCGTAAGKPAQSRSCTAPVTSQFPVSVNTQQASGITGLLTAVTSNPIILGILVFAAIALILSGTRHMLQKNPVRPIERAPLSEYVEIPNTATNGGSHPDSAAIPTTKPQEEPINPADEGSDPEIPENPPEPETSPTQEDSKETKEEDSSGQ